MKNKYVLGIDYGTLSGRCVLVRCSDGRIMATAVKEYTHGVMTERLMDEKTALPKGWALQHPQDYVEILENTIPKVVSESKVKPKDIIGLSIDFTSCTILPVDKYKVPLCTKKEYASRPHAYVKLWKHHGAQKEAEEINEQLAKNKAMKDQFGDRISPELFLPKVMEMIHEDYVLYQVADKIMEAADWLTWLLTDSVCRSGSMAGYKAWWTPDKGYPNKEFFKSIDPRLEDFIEDKIGDKVCPVGEKVGLLNETWSQKLGLQKGIAVGASIIDSHAGAPGSGIYKKDQLMMVVGTSSVLMGFSHKPWNKNGICGYLKGGVAPGYYGLESGLAAVGDAFGWFMEECVPERYYRQAEEKKITVHEYLSRLASEKKPGETGLLVLDWLNGNKTPFVNAGLSGNIMGLTLGTKAEDIYRALIEGTAYGTRRIIEEMEQSGIQIKEIIASGGIAEKNELFLQIYADITGKKIRIAACNQTAALGAGIYAAIAAGKAAGGYDDYVSAVKAMGRTRDKEYIPIPENMGIYQKLYRLYLELSHYMGDKDSLMNRMNL